MTTKKPNVKPNKTICIDHDITEIVEKITELGGKLSPVVCNLLRFYRDNDYRIPVKEIIIDPDHPDFVEPEHEYKPGGESVLD